MPSYPTATATDTLDVSDQASLVWNYYILSHTHGASIIFGASATLGATPLVPPGPVNFAFTGAIQQYLVPAGVYQLSFDLIGAQGGGSGLAGQKGGPGCEVIGTVSVQPGDLVEVYVGGTPSGQSGGWGGTPGGRGGNGQYPGFGGGGSTEIWINGQPLVSAPGGGGAAGLAPSATRPGAGGAGGLSGVAGSGSPPSAGGQGAEAGTPGTGGTSAATGGNNGSGTSGGAGVGTYDYSGGAGGGGGSWVSSGGGGAAGGLNGANTYYPAGGGGGAVNLIGTVYDLATLDSGGSAIVLSAPAVNVQTVGTGTNTSGNGSATISTLPVAIAQITSPEVGEALDVYGSGLTVDWNYVPGNSGNSQLGYTIRAKQSSATSYGYWNGTDFTSAVPIWKLGFVTSATVPYHVLANGVTYQISVALWDQDGYGDFATDVSIVAAEPPTVTSVTPNGTIENDTLPAVTWVYTASTATSAPQASFQVWVYEYAVVEMVGFDPASFSTFAVQTSGLVLSAATTYDLTGEALNASVAYSVFVQVEDTNSLTSSIVESDFTIDTEFPAIPTVVVALYNDPDSGAPGLQASVTWDPTDFTGDPATVDLWWSDDGVTWYDTSGNPQLVLGSGQALTAGSTPPWFALFIDHHAPLGTDRYYQAVVTVAT